MVAVTSADNSGCIHPRDSKISRSTKKRLYTRSYQPAYRNRLANAGRNCLLSGLADLGISYLTQTHQAKRLEIEMAMRMIDFDPVDSEFMGSVMVDKVVRLSKTEDGEYTVIHLMDGTTVLTKDSMKTVSAKINSGE